MTHFLLWCLFILFLLRRLGYFIHEVQSIPEKCFTENDIVGAIIGIMIGLCVDGFFIILAFKYFTKFIV